MRGNGMASPGPQVRPTLFYVAFSFALLLLGVDSKPAQADTWIKPLDELPAPLVWAQHGECLSRITRACLLTKALEHARRIETPYYRFIGLNAVAAAEWKLEEVTAEQLQIADAEPLEHVRAWYLQEIAQVKRDDASFDRATRAARSIRQAFSRIDALIAIARVRRDRALLDEALGVAPAAAFKKTAIAHAYAELGLFAEAYETARSELAGNNRFLAEYAIVEIAKVQALAGQHEEALAILRDFSPQSLDRDWVLLAIASIASRAGLPGDALNEAKAISKPQDRAQALAAIGAATGDPVFFDRAMKDASQITNEQRRVETLTEVASQIKDRQAFKAILVAIDATTWTYRDRAAARISKFQAKSGYVDDALETARKLRQVEERVGALLEILRVHRDASLIQEAAQAVLSASAVADWEWRQDLFRAICLSKIAVLLPVGR